MTTKWRSIVMSGASGGIGRALVPELAEPGVRMLLIGRDAERLASAAAIAREGGAEVETLAMDVRDAEAMAARILAFDDHAPVDLAISGAGVSSGTDPSGTAEPPGRLREVVEVNLFGAAAMIEPLIPRMIARRSGHLALIGSIAALRPLPDMPAYSASKAGLRAWGTSLRGALAPYGVVVTVISPGFVTSPMSARHLGAKPFEISAERAARLIRHGLARRHRLITFPHRLALLAWLGSRLPARLSDFAARGFATKIAPEGKDGPPPA